MVTTFDVDADKLVNKAAVALEKDGITAPSWAPFVKTGSCKERPPLQNNWWQIRCAAVLRSVYVKGPIGVAKLRKKYGSNKNRGLRPKRFALASGSILRKSLQQLQKAGYVEYQDKGIKKGRIVTGKGKKLLDNLAKSIHDGTL